MLTIISLVWARTVKSPNPAYSDVDIPLVKSFVLSKKNNIWVEPVISPDRRKYDFVVRVGGEPTLSGTVNQKGESKNGAICIMSSAPVDFTYIRNEASTERMSKRLMAVVCEGKKERVYLSPNVLEDVCCSGLNNSFSLPNISLPQEALGFRIQRYGMLKWHQLYSDRQLLVLSTYSNLVKDVINSLKSQNLTDQDYVSSLGTYLAFIVDKCSDYWSSISSWNNIGEKIRNTFGRQTIQMTWDYAETNPFSNSTGNWCAMMNWICEVLEKLPACGSGFSYQADAQTQTISTHKIISTDPPYYDNIGYADLSDYFYYWLRPLLKNIYPDIFGTITTPKDDELIANPFRHGSKKEAEEHFLYGMKDAMSQLSTLSHPAYPITIYYAFKQAETTKAGTASTGWDTILEAVIQSGFSITGTLPVQTELNSRMRSLDSNALLSSIVLVCRRRDANAPLISHREFVKELYREMPKALAKMTGETEDEKNEYKVSAVDLAQSAIGPGMEIFSKYSGILEANGSKMTVHEALVLINRVLSAYLDKDEDEYDADTKFCKAWFEQYGWKEGDFGTADTLSRAKGTSVDGLVEAGVVSAKGGKVRLIHFSEYADDWDASKDNRVPIWEALHHMVKAHQKGGDFKAAAVYAQVESMTSAVNLLATRLYQMCEQKGWAEDARPYNELSAAWQAISENAGRAATAPARAPGKKKEDGQRTLSGF